MYHGFRTHILCIYSLANFKESSFHHMLQICNIWWKLFLTVWAKYFASVDLAYVVRSHRCKWTVQIEAECGLYRRTTVWITSVGNNKVAQVQLHVNVVFDRQSLGSANSYVCNAVSAILSIVAPTCNLAKHHFLVMQENHTKNVKGSFCKKPIS